MTQEEAIKIFEGWAQCNYAPTKEAAWMALSALRPVSREQADKAWKGCDICQRVPMERIGINEKEIYTADCMEVAVNESFQYCPRCGRPLTGEAMEMLMKKLEALNDGKGD